MLTVDIPNFKCLRLRYAVLDFNGTVSLDGRLLSGVAERLAILREHLEVHLVTSDTFGTARDQMGELAKIQILRSGNHRNEKQVFVEMLGAEFVVAIGNGRNDCAMLSAAALGIAVCQQEGGSAEAIQSADIVCRDITDALDLLLSPMRLIATLRG